MLTTILRDSLSGISNTVMIANMHADFMGEFSHESVSTAWFAMRCAMLKMQPRMKPATKRQQLEAENVKLKEELWQL